MDKQYALTGGFVLSGDENMTAEEGLTVLVKGNRIEDIVQTSAASLSGYEIIDLKGAYLMPGLINLHVHLPASGNAAKENAKPVNYKKLFQLLNIPGVKTGFKKLQDGLIRQELMSGVTTIRTVGGILDFDTKARDRISKGKLAGPRILAANTGVSVPGGHFAGSLASESTTKAEARLTVRRAVNQGADLIKLMVTGGVMDASEEGEPGVLRMPLELIEAACDEAHKAGLPVAAHVESTEGVKAALKGGVDTIEHGARIDEECIRLFKETGAAHVCTISPAVPYALFPEEESHCGDLGRKNGRIVFEGIVSCANTCLSKGIPVGLGTDTGCPFIRDYDMWREVVYFKNWCKVSNAFALYSATKGNAKIAGIDKEVGTIAPGMLADMIATKENPLEDLKALRHVDMIMYDGKLIEKPVVKINQKIEQLLDKYIDFTPEDYKMFKNTND